jgi:hypothetical protein
MMHGAAGMQGQGGMGMYGYPDQMQQYVGMGMGMQGGFTGNLMANTPYAAAQMFGGSMNRPSAAQQQVLMQLFSKSFVRARLSRACAVDRTSFPPLRRFLGVTHNLSFAFLTDQQMSQGGQSLGMYGQGHGMGGMMGGYFGGGGGQMGMGGDILGQSMGRDSDRSAGGYAGEQQQQHHEGEQEDKEAEEV